MKLTPNFAAAFAVLLARGGSRASYIDANNEKIGEAPILAAVRTDRPYFVMVRPEVLALDGDAPKTNERIVHEFVVEVCALGFVPVLVASGNPERPESHHVFVQVLDPVPRERLADRARNLGFDVRQAIRPPLAPHRLGGCSVLLQPPNPLDALVALAPTTRPPRRLRGRARRVAKEGASDRSLAAARTTLALVNRGWSDGAIAEFLLNPQNAAGGKVQAINDPSSQRRRIARLCATARAKALESPPYRTRSDVDATLSRILASLANWPERWQGRSGSRLYVTARVAIQIARRCGSLSLHPGCRFVAEELGINWRTANSSLHSLAGYGVVHLARPGGGAWPHTWELTVPPAEGRNIEDHGHLPLGGAVGEVSPCCCGGGVPLHIQLPCLEDFAAADVFGPNSWFGTKGLGFPAWHALIVIESFGDRPTPRDELTTRLGRSTDAAIRALERVALVQARADGYVRGPTTLIEAARRLRTLGSRTWKRAQHVDERRVWRERTPTSIGPQRMAAIPDDVVLEATAGAIDNG
jgi:hypothetical protein